MTFAQAVRTCFAKYATFSGRASRPEYWWFFLFLLLGSAIAGVLDGPIFGTAEVAASAGDGDIAASAPNNGPIGSIFALATLDPRRSPPAGGGCTTPAGRAFTCSTR